MEVLAEKTRQALNLGSKDFEPFSLEAHDRMLDSLSEFAGELKRYDKATSSFYHSLFGFAEMTGRFILDAPQTKVVGTLELPIASNTSKPDVASGPQPPTVITGGTQSTVLGGGTGPHNHMAPAGPQEGVMPAVRAPTTPSTTVAADLPSQYHHLLSRETHKRLAVQAPKIVAQEAKKGLMQPVQLWLKAFDSAKERLHSLEGLKLKADARKRKIEKKINKGTTESDEDVHDRAIDEFEAEQAALYQQMCWLSRGTGRLRAYLTDMMLYMEKCAIERVVPENLLEPFPVQGMLPVKDQSNAAHHKTEEVVETQEHILGRDAGHHVMHPGPCTHAPSPVAHLPPAEAYPTTPTPITAPTGTPSHADEVNPQPALTATTSLTGTTTTTATSPEGTVIPQTMTSKMVSPEDQTKLNLIDKAVGNTQSVVEGTVKTVEKVAGAGASAFVGGAVAAMQTMQHQENKGILARGAETIAEKVADAFGVESVSGNPVADVQEVLATGAAEAVRGAAAAAGVVASQESPGLLPSLATKVGLVKEEKLPGIVHKSGADVDHAVAHTAMEAGAENIAMKLGAGAGQGAAVGASAAEGAMHRK